MEFAISVAAAVAAVGSIPLTAGASAGVAIATALPAAIGAAAGMADAAVKANNVAVGGASVEQIVQSLKNGIDKLTEEIRVQQDKIAGVLDAYGSAVYQQKGIEKSLFVTPRPRLAGMEGSTLMGNEGLGTYN